MTSNHRTHDVNDSMAEHDWTVEEIAMLCAAQVDATVASPNSISTSDTGDVVEASPPTIPRRPVSGRYQGSSGSLSLELRIDMDGKRPTRRVSGDLYRTTGQTVKYVGSFVLDNPTVTVAPSTTMVTIRGRCRFSFTAPTTIVTVRIVRATLLAPAGQAHVTFTPTPFGTVMPITCVFVSPFFRNVLWEQDQVTGTTPFVSYDTSQLPSGGANRVLTVVRCYEEAGLAMQQAGTANAIPVGGAGTDALWSDAELHASMQSQFSLWQNSPQWRVWLLVATMHEMGNGLRGIMFDQSGAQRQGCAVFDQVIGGAAADSQRAQLRTYVHELGHCFNLLHSWQKSLAMPPQPDRPAALSWMNYVQNFPGGAAAYWAQFPFQFDDPELVHLRHGFRNDVIMGGSDFGAGAADFDYHPFQEPIEDHSGLRLVLDSPRSFALGEPVVVEIKLYGTNTQGVTVHRRLHPNFGFVRVAIQKPSREIVAYQPAIEHCIEEETTLLNPEQPSIYESAYVGFGKPGHYFQQPGIYQLRAIYVAPDGSEVVSNIASVRIRTPLSSEDEEIADLYSESGAGMLFYLLGSDSESLRASNADFDLVLDKYAKHRLAVYAQLVKGINAGRYFKTVGALKKASERKPVTNEAVSLLDGVISASKKGVGVNNITLNFAMRRLARVHRKAGDQRKAKAALNQLVTYFKDRSLKPHVLRRIQAQATREAESN